MPNYTFQNKDTNEEITLTLSMAEREEYLKNNPNMEQIIVSAPAIGDPFKLGRVKTDSHFRERLKHIHKTHAHSKINTGNLTEV